MPTALRRQVLTAAGAGKNQSLRSQLIQSRQIGISALALSPDFAIPVQPQALQVGQDGFCRPGHFPRWIEILDPHQPTPAYRPCRQKAPDGGEQRSGVQAATGRWGEATDNAS